MSSQIKEKPSLNDGFYTLRESSWMIENLHSFIFFLSSEAGQQPKLRCPNCHFFQLSWGESRGVLKPAERCLGSPPWSFRPAGNAQNTSPRKHLGDMWTRCLWHLSWLLRALRRAHLHILLSRGNITIRLCSQPCSFNLDLRSIGAFWKKDQMVNWKLCFQTATVIL